MGLYLAPPENAVVLCVDEESQIQALDRTQPILPMQPGLIERRCHDYVRHGTTTLFAALETATGQVAAALKPRYHRREFLAFLRQVACAYPEGELRLVMDGCGAHKTPEVRDWLEANLRISVHFTPTHASWMSLHEVWFSLVERQAIRRGVSTSVAELNATIHVLVTGWNEPSHPFTWTKTADEILTKANRKNTSEANL